MAKLTEIVVAIEAEGVDRVLSALKQVDGAQARVADSSKKHGDAQKTANESAGMSWATLATGVNQALGVINAAVQAGKAVYDFTKEGAQLEYAAGKFDRLAEAAGTTSDVLLNDLKEATQGVVSDSELMASAGDFMALGLAKTHEEVVRLTTVAGALGMNMNQLVLTLTNQTTMRFDALGVSVDGFKEKVAALEAAGYSAQDAFTEAFLQQAEGQIQRVGPIAETSAGKLMMMESAFKNLGDAAKLSVADALEPFVPAITNIANEMLENVEISTQWKTAIDQLKTAKDKDLISGAEYNDLLRDIGVHSGMGVVTAKQLATAQAAVDQIYGYSADSVVTYTEAIQMGKAQMALMTAETEAASVEALVAASDFEGLAKSLGITTDQAKEMITAWEDSAEAHAMMLAELDNITSLEGNYQGIISLAYKFTDILEDITEQETIMANNPIGSEKYEEAKAKAEELKGTMAELANRVTLDMFQATIAIGGVTEAELSAYMQMAIDMGLMSEDGAQAAMDAYSNAIATINAYEIDEKTGNVVINAEEAYATLVMIQQMQIADKNANINLFTRYYGTTGGYDPYENYEGPGTAIGGPVYPGQFRTWNEPGREGELLIPEQYGRVLSNHEVAQVMREALMGGGVGEKNGSGSTVINNYSYVLTMPTTSNPADVRTAFELMEAWN